MTFKELKKSTLYQTSDIDDMHVMLCVSRNGKQQLEPLSYLAINTAAGREFVIIGGLTELQRMVESGEMPKPEGYVDPSITDPLIFDDGTGSH